MAFYSVFPIVAEIYSYLECFSQEEALLDVVLLTVDGVDVLDSRVAGLGLAVAFQGLK